VVAFELGDVVVDVAGDRGASAGALLELWRPLNIKHPVTGQMVSDRFLIGRLRLVQVRSALSLALPDGKLTQPAQPGDIVVLHRAVSAHVATKSIVPEPVAATVPLPLPGTSVPVSPAPDAQNAKPEPVELGGGGSGGRRGERNLRPTARSRRASARARVRGLRDAPSARQIRGRFV